jgi:hypothetical protein
MLDKRPAICLAAAIGFIPIVLAPMTASAQVTPAWTKLTPLNDAPDHAPADATPLKKAAPKLVKKTWASPHRRRPECVRKC